MLKTDRVIILVKAGILKWENEPLLILAMAFKEDKNIFSIECYEFLIHIIRGRVLKESGWFTVD